jgi:hypothetical protein
MWYKILNPPQAQKVVRGAAVAVHFMLGPACSHSEIYKNASKLPPLHQPRTPTQITLLIKHPKEDASPANRRRSNILSSVRHCVKMRGVADKKRRRCTRQTGRIMCGGTSGGTGGDTQILGSFDGRDVRVVSARMRRPSVL